MMTDVLIVGAGPTGLTVANLLARYKLNFKIIDKKAGPINQSRANIVHVRTLELLDKLSLAEKAIKQGVKITDVKVFERGKHITTLPIGSPEEKDWTPFPYALALEQSKTERLLLEEMEKYGVRVEWCTEFLNLTQTDDEVSVMVKRPDGNEEKITARWLVGADGASSPVRHALKVGFSGSTYEVDSFQADIELEASHSSNAVHLHLCHGILVGMTPLYGECHFRIFGSISSEFAAKFNANETQSVSLEDLQAWLDKYFFINTKLTHIYWTALYHTHRRIADHFRIGRCFLVGDAAHVHSPAGGQGMNLGIGDGYNLAWKLALVINKHAHPNLLDSYEAERIPVANMILNGSDVGFELETSNKPVMQWFRFYVLPLFINLLLRLSVVRSAIVKVFSQTWIDYRNSPVVAESASACDRAPYGVFEEEQTGKMSLFDLLKGTEYHVLIFEGLQPDPKFSILQKELFDLLARYKVAVCIHLITNKNDNLHQQYGAQTSCLFLIRPDGHIAFQGQLLKLDDFEAYLDKWFTQQELLSLKE